MQLHAMPLIISLASQKQVLVNRYYKIQYQMNKANKKVIDTVSASELLEALNTLQHMSDPDNQVEISFSEESKVKSEFRGNNSKVMNYDQYMAKKVQRKDKSNYYQRKSISPLKDHNIDQTIKICNLKSRSHSPMMKRVEKTDRSMLITQKKILKPQFLHKQNKQNKRQDHNSKYDNLYRASFQSKKILDQKEKKGSVYVPIQFRTQQLIKGKQIKMAKLQKQKEMSNILREKQCTFKPNIIKNYKKNKPISLKEKEEQKYLKLIAEQSIRFDSGCEQNQFLCTPTQPLLDKQVHQLSTQYLISNCARQNLQQNDSKQPIKKYKNDKFNFLLDLIH